MAVETQIKLAMECIQSSIRLISEGKVEDVIRQNFTSFLRSMFPDQPNWVEHHIEGGETAVKYAKSGKIRTGFIDNLVGLTAIEYESNLTIKSKFKTGLEQIKNYSASLINEGHDPGHIIGVLSDTVRWRAYRIKPISYLSSGKLASEHIELEEIERLDLSEADENAAKNLVTFLQTYLGRLGSRPLNAESLAKDFGPESRFSSAHIEQIKEIVTRAFVANPQYGNLISDLWKNFVGSIHTESTGGEFDQQSYIDEFYIVTVAKLVIANVIERRAIISEDDQLRSILIGEYFKNKGLNNLVEYDYFGWLNSGETLEALLPMARELQHDLRAYDFRQIPDEDLFGRMMTQLATRSQRLLLGQEWTPSWLARQMVEKVVSGLPEDENLNLVDMCCGSGAIIVEAVKLAKERIARSADDLSHEQMLNLLTQAITGFDIDPLAVMLSKISWILAARDWLEPYGAYPVTIPIFHADSLFALTPLSLLDDEEHQEYYSLRIAGNIIQLPSFLISPDYQRAFDAILDFGYDIAIHQSSSPLTIDDEVIDEYIDSKLKQFSAEITSDKIEKTKTFLVKFVTIIHRLNKDGLNGIWAFILRNSYRPGLVSGQFNGLVSNPPWLALSKIGDNPYQGVLKRKAEKYGIRPTGPSFLHIEMATIFLLHATDQYLKNGAIIGCITPETVLNGYHHAPFRQAAYNNLERPVNLKIEEIWRVQEQTFKNKAIVIFGKKTEEPSHESSDTIAGALVETTGLTPIMFHKITQGKRTAWSESPSTGGNGFFSPAKFQQGADIMPRTLFFHELEPVSSIDGKIQWRVSPIDINTSNIAFAIKDAKNLRSFKINPCILPDDLFFDVVISNLLTPFDMAPPLKALLPIKKQADGAWRKLSNTEIATKGHAAISTFRQIAGALDPTLNSDAIWGAINTRSKLTRQVIVPEGYIVFTGTSGQYVCSAFLDVKAIDTNKFIVDQTLNWACVETIEEAIYLTGLFNSEAINLVIQDFQPEGQFGKRHIHSLPFGVTPPFDPTQVAHLNVVEATKKLMKDYHAAKEQDQDLAKYLNPNKGSLQQRRSQIRNKLRKMPSYGEYDIACRTLYQV